MSERRVVLLRKRSLLAAGIETVLREDGGVAVGVVSPDDSEAATKIHAWRPDVILMDSTDPGIGEGMVVHLLQTCPGATVIALTPDQPGMEVYRMQREPDTDPSGLVHLIQQAGTAAPAPRT